MRSGLTEKAVWNVVRGHARKAGIEKLAPYDLRRTCARLCHAAGGELEQIQFLLGHVSIQTTERYLGCKQRIGRLSMTGLALSPRADLRPSVAGLPTTLDLAGSEHADGELRRSSGVRNSPIKIMLNARLADDFWTEA
jgi:hypothetical protein